MTVSKVLSKYILDLVGVKVISCDRCGKEPPGEYIFFYEKRNESHELHTLFCCIRGISRSEGLVSY
jgi:hypothetical protein